MWVIKIGGSLESAPGLRPLLALLADYGRSGVVIVPGGGRFAEQVRAEQRQTGMDDARAHRRALLAMEAYGAALCGMEPRLYPVTDIGEITPGDASGVPVWFPSRILSARTDIPASWQVTSDSLALWFAGEINADGLVLVKSVSGRTNKVRELATTGYLDEYFPQMMQQTDLEMITCLGVDEQEVLRQTLVSGTLPARKRLFVGSSDTAQRRVFNAGFFLPGKAGNE